MLYTCLVFYNFSCHIYGFLLFRLVITYLILIMAVHGICRTCSILYMLYFVHALLSTCSILFLTLWNSCAVVFPGEDDGLFVIEVVPNGFFCGLRDNLCYVDSSIAHFDNCTANT
jgi:hypothetical protein